MIHCMIKYLLLLAATLGLVSCAGTTTNPPSSAPVIVAPEDNAKFCFLVEGACTILEVGGKVALATQTAATQKEYAAYLSGSGHVYESLQTGKVPTDAQVQNALSAYFPTSSGKYTTIVQLGTSALSPVITWIKVYIPPSWGNAGDYVNYVLAKLAKVCYDVADPYLK